MRINTPTEFIETDAPVQIRLVGQRARRGRHGSGFEGRRRASKIGGTWQLHALIALGFALGAALFAGLLGARRHRAGRAREPAHQHRGRARPRAALPQQHAGDARRHHLAGRPAHPRRQGQRDRRPQLREQQVDHLRATCASTRRAATCSSDEAVVTFAQQPDHARHDHRRTGAVRSSSAKDGAEPARGRAHTIDYETASGNVSLKDEAWLSDGCNEIRGEQLVYNIRSQSVQAQAAAPAAGATGDGQHPHHHPAADALGQTVRGARKKTMSVLRATHLAKSYKTPPSDHRPLRRSGERADRRAC